MTKMKAQVLGNKKIRITFDTKMSKLLQMIAYNSKSFKKFMGF